MNIKAKVITNQYNPPFLQDILNQVTSFTNKWSNGNITITLEVQASSFDNVPYEDIVQGTDPVTGIQTTAHVPSRVWYDANITPLAGDSDVTIALFSSAVNQSNVQGYMYGTSGKAYRIFNDAEPDNLEQNYNNQFGTYVLSHLILHELSHMYHHLTGQTDTTHEFDYKENNLAGAYQDLNYSSLQAGLENLRSMLGTGENMRAIPPLTAYKRGSLPDDQTCYVKQENGVMCAITSWEAYLGMGGESNLVQTVSAQDEGNFIWDKNIFLSKN